MIFHYLPVSTVGGYLGRPDSDIELMILTCSFTLVVVFAVQSLVSLLAPKREEKEDCCISKFVRERRAKSAGEASIVSGNPEGEEGFAREVRNHLISIQRELHELKREREIMDAELMETSTQILQTIGVTLMAQDDEINREYAGSPDFVPIVNVPIHKPVVQRVSDVSPSSSVRSQSAQQVPPVQQPAMVAPAAQRIVGSQQPPIVQPVVRAPVQAPVQPPVQAPVQPPAQAPVQPRVQAPVQPPVQTPVQLPALTQVQPSHQLDRSPVSPKSPVLMVTCAPVQQISNAAPSAANPLRVVPTIPMQPPVQVPQPRSHSSSPVSNGGPALSAAPPQPAPSKAAAPKMSALAAARLKREQEMTEAKAASAVLPACASTNPFGAKPGPFGAVAPM